MICCKSVLKMLSTSYFTLNLDQFLSIHSHHHISPFVNVLSPPSITNPLPLNSSIQSSISMLPLTDCY